MQDLDRLMEIIQDFVSAKIPAEDFTREYHRLFLTAIPPDDEIFQILDRMDADANAFTNDYTLIRDHPDYYIDEDRLRASAMSTLEDIAGYLEPIQ